MNDPGENWSYAKLSIYKQTLQKIRDFVGGKV
jgi:hypothetical protein